MVISFRDNLLSNKIDQSTVLIKKSCVDEIGLLDEKQEFVTVKDYDYWLRVLKYQDNSVFVLKDVLVFCRIHQSNL